MTPSKDRSGTILGYHSNRRVPDRDVLENAIFPLYDELLQEERRHGDRKSGLQASKQLIDDFLAEKPMVIAWHSTRRNSRSLEGLPDMTKPNPAKASAKVEVVATANLFIVPGPISRPSSTPGPAIWSENGGTHLYSL